MLTIRLALGWARPGRPLRSAFKQSESLALLEEYTERTSRFTPCEASGFDLESANALEDLKTSGTCVWVCDRGPSAKILSSEEVAAALEKVLGGGVKKLVIVVGAADGFPNGWLDKVQPRLRWSFGKMTLPHELAAVVAAEQLYRAWSIVKGLPYHGAH